MNALVNFTPTHGNNLFILLSTRRTSESTAFRLMLRLHKVKHSEREHYYNKCIISVSLHSLYYDNYR